MEWPRPIPAPASRACAPLEDETYRAVRSARTKTSIRDRVLSSAAEAAGLDLRRRSGSRTGVRMPDHRPLGGQQHFAVPQLPPRGLRRAVRRVEVEQKTARVDPTWFYR